MKFVDEVEIQVASGKGGPGKVSFRREALIARGGPDGGDGGDGGDVIFRVDPQIHSLLDLRFKHVYQAEDGAPGEGSNRAGKNGNSVVIRVPPGTQIKDPQGHLILDLDLPGDHLFLKGGLGGKGNVFYKSSVNQAPSVAQKGMPGESKVIRLELKLIADVGLLGCPNAGKSSLIASLSAARPKVADYPFTTLTPNLGVVRFRDELNFVMADVPGLIEGAAEGVGLGTQFLRHIERTKLLVHLVDVSPLVEDPIKNYHLIREELRKHDAQKLGEEGYLPLTQRKEIVVLNKCDTRSKEEVSSLEKQFKMVTGQQPLCVSAVSRLNLKELVLAIGKILFAQTD